MNILRRIGVLLLAAAPCCVWAQGVSIAGRMTSQPLPGGSISGHVYCADTNAPARFARISLTTAGGTSHGRPSPLVVTGLDGSFQIPNVGPGSYYVTASMAGYVNPLSEVASEDIANSDPAAQARVAQVLSPVTVTGNENVRTEVRLERGASLSGTVYYDDGSPAGNVMVIVQTAPTNGTTSRTVRTDFSMPSPHTDDYGRYRLTGLANGDYIVLAYAQTFPAEVPGDYGHALFSSLRIYAPRSFTTADAKVYTLKTGTEMTGADILIPLAAFHTVSGTAESTDGHTLNAGSLTLVDQKDKSHNFHAYVRHDGQFSFLYVPEGAYTLTISQAAVTEPDTTSSNNRGYPSNRTKTVQSYGTATQSVMVQSGDLSNVVLQVKPSTATGSSAASANTVDTVDPGQP